MGSEIWLLISTGILNAPGPHPGEDAIQTRVFAYASRRSACSAIRGFVRQDLDEELERRAEAVNEALDSVFAGNEDLESDGDGMWTYDGSNRSYEWRLLRLEVRNGKEGQ